MEKENEYVEYIFEFKRKDALALLEALYCKTEIPRTIAISATPLVRCKDCKRYHKTTCPFLIANAYKASSENDYCSKGEEEEDGDRF